MDEHPSSRMGSFHRVVCGEHAQPIQLARDDLEELEEYPGPDNHICLTDRGILTSSTSRHQRHPFITSSTLGNSDYGVNLYLNFNYYYIPKS